MRQASRIACSLQSKELVACAAASEVAKASGHTGTMYARRMTEAVATQTTTEKKRAS